MRQISLRRIAIEAFCPHCASTVVIHPNVVEQLASCSEDGCRIFSGIFPVDIETKHRVGCILPSRHAMGEEELDARIGAIAVR